MNDLVYYLRNLLIFWYSIIITMLLTLYSSQLMNNLLSFFGDVYLPFGIFLTNSIFSVLFVTVSGVLCGEILETFVILSAILLPVKSPAASVDFWIALFELLLRASVADF